MQMSIGQLVSFHVPRHTIIQLPYGASVNSKQIFVLAGLVTLSVTLLTMTFMYYNYGGHL